MLLEILKKRSGPLGVTLDVILIEEGRKLYLRPQLLPIDAFLQVRLER